MGWAGSGPIAHPEELLAPDWSEEDAVVVFTCVPLVYRRAPQVPMDSSELGHIDDSACQNQDVKGKKRSEERGQMWQENSQSALHTCRLKVSGKQFSER